MKSGNTINSKTIEIDISLSDDNILVKASTTTDDIGILKLTTSSNDRVQITQFGISTYINSVFTTEQLNTGLKGLGRIMLYESLETGISESLFNRESVIYTTDADLWIILEKLKFEKKDGIIQQQVGVVFDVLRNQIGTLGNGFAPIGAGTYGCVFMPHLPSEGVSSGAPRDPHLISKLMTIENANNEFDEQIAVKEQLDYAGILKPEYEEKQYLFSIGGVQKVGDISDDDLVGYETKCRNFRDDIRFSKSSLQDPKNRNNFRKLDGLDGGRDLVHWTNILTPTILKDMLTAFAKEGGLLDAIVQMNDADVFHSDLKSGNLVWKGGDNPIGIIDWGLAHVDMGEDEDDWGMDADFPMSAWMYNTPMISVIYNEPFQKAAETLNFSKYRDDEHMLSERLQNSLMHNLFTEKKNPNYQVSHIATLKNNLNIVLGLNSITTRCRQIFSNKVVQFTKKEQIFLTVLTEQMMSVYKHHPEAIGGDGSSFWDKVYKHNSDIWGAMTTFIDVTKILTIVGGTQNFGEVVLLHKILEKVFVSNEWQYGKIDVDSLKSDMLAFADTFDNNELFFEATKSA
jgi:hypothetical protein